MAPRGAFGSSPLVAAATPSPRLLSEAEADAVVRFFLSVRADVRKRGAPEPDAYEPMKPIASRLHAAQLSTRSTREQSK